MAFSSFVLCGTFAPQPALLCVLPLCNLITHGYFSSANNGYRLKPWNKLARDFIGTQPIGKCKVLIEVYSGATVSEISAQCDAALGMKFNVVLLHAETNEMNRPSDSDTAPDGVGSLIDKIITTCRTFAILVTKIILSSNADTMAPFNT
ncbi:hypothetical protein BDW71DRAFT_212355 [Aspergillus fruticulosus]